MALDRGNDLRGSPRVGVPVAGQIHSQGIVGLELFQQVIHVRRLDNWKKKEAVVRTVNAGLGVYLRFR